MDDIKQKRCSNNNPGYQNHTMKFGNFEIKNVSIVSKFDPALYFFIAIGVSIYHLTRVKLSEESSEQNTFYRG